MAANVAPVTPDLPGFSPGPGREELSTKGAGRALFVAILLLIAGVLNIIYGLGAIGNANFFTLAPYSHMYVFANLHTWGWITFILGLVQVTAGVSLMGGRTYGRLIGIFAAGLGALDAVVGTGGINNFWSLAVFALCLWILWGLVTFGEPETA